MEVSEMALGTRLQVWLSGVAVVLAVMVGAGAAQAKRGGDGLQVNVDVSGQRMDVYVDGQLKHRWRVSTGRDGFDTPGGTFKPQRLEREWYSRKYDNAPMPNAVFFNGGYAIHGTTDTKRLGRAASHGCIRLHPANAEELFDLVEEHGARRTRIVVDN
jgi:lipoprotein-anchoring transpeptidase ErfK/SrfK